MNLKELIDRLSEIVRRLANEGEALQQTSSELNTITGGPAPPPPITPPSLPIHEHYKIFRSYVEHEDALTNNRLLWNINIQGFLYAAYGFAIEKLVEVQSSECFPKVSGTGAIALHWFIFFLPILGIFISFISWMGVMAAQGAIAALKNKWEKVLKTTDDPVLPGLTGGGNDKHHKLGFLAPRLFPWLFIETWLLLFLSRYRRG